MDGIYRMVTVVNNSIPGPAIIVYEGQEVVVHVRNRLVTQPTIVHWHGIPMFGTPWMDGATYVTQCPILPGQTFTYKFKVFVTVFFHTVYCLVKESVLDLLMVECINTDNLLLDSCIKQRGPGTRTETPTSTVI